MTYKSKLKDNTWKWKLFGFILTLVVGWLLTGCGAVEQSQETAHARYELSSEGTTATGIASLGTINEDTVADNGKYRAYDFRTTGSVGYLPKLSGEGVDRRETDAYYGIRAEIADSKITWTAYSYLKGVEPTGEASILRTSNGNGVKLSGIKKGVANTIDTSKQKNDLFALTAKFSNGQNAMLFLWVNDGNAYVVTATKASEKTIRKTLADRQALQEQVSKWGVTPENSLSVSEIAYPTYDYPDDPTDRCDTSLWQSKANELVPDKSIPDGVKASIVHDWIVQNLNYDDYVADTDKSRQKANNDYSGRWSTWNTKAGVCRDFSNIYVIMMRELGVPATIIASNSMNHEWNAIWLDGRWQEADMTPEVSRKVKTADVTKVKTVSKDNRDSYLVDGLLYAEKNISCVGHAIYTVTFATKGVKAVHVGCK